MLNDDVIEQIHDSVDDLFDFISGHFLGGKRDPKGIVFSVNSDLDKLYNEAAQISGITPDEDNLLTLKRVASSYLESTRDRTKAQIVRAVEATLREAQLSGVETDMKTVLGGKLSELFAKTADHVQTIVETELNTARNLSTMEGIVEVNEKMGVQDPVVFFVIVRDNKVCKECMRLHMMPDGITPRLWYLSELGHDYHKKGDPMPKLSGLHPHCRCALTTLPLGGGFDENGRVTYVAPNYSAIKAQRS